MGGADAGKLVVVPNRPPSLSSSSSGRRVRAGVRGAGATAAAKGAGAMVEGSGAEANSRLEEQGVRVEKVEVAEKGAWVGLVVGLTRSAKLPTRCRTAPSCPLAAWWW